MLSKIKMKVDLVPSLLPTGEPSTRKLEKEAGKMFLHTLTGLTGLTRLTGLTGSGTRLLKSLKTYTGTRL